MNALLAQPAVDIPHETSSPIALLIDGDNVQASQYPQILAQATKLGKVFVRRVYMDTQHLPNWSGVPGLRLMVTTTGNNAADLLMTVDAMELALRDKVTRFVLASSDAGFSHLALRLREYGLTVHGLGGPQRSARFRDACTEFAELPALKQVVAVVARQAAPKVEPQSPLDQMICSILKAAGGQLRIDALNPRIRAEMDVKIAELPEKTWRAYLLKRPDLYVVDPKGPEACVRRAS